MAPVEGAGRSTDMASMQALPALDAEARSSDDPAAARRTVVVLTALLSLYLGLLALLVALDQITMVWKSLVIPALPPYVPE